MSKPKSLFLDPNDPSNFMEALCALVHVYGAPTVLIGLAVLSCKAQAQAIMAGDNKSANQIHESGRLSLEAGAVMIGPDQASLGVAALGHQLDRLIERETGVAVVDPAAN